MYKPKKRIYLLFILSVILVASAFKTTIDYFEVSKNLEIFSDAYKEVNTSYVDEVESGRMIRKAIDAMLKDLDPYTNFYSEAQKEDYQLEISGSYTGIGMTTTMIDGRVVVDKVYQNYPAQKAGLKIGDIILEIDGKEISNDNRSDLLKLIKGNAGTKVVLKIDRPYDEIKTFEVTRANVKVLNVPYSGLITDEVGIIQLTGFTPNAGNEVRSALKELKEKHQIKGLVLDLRGNPGGLLHEAINVVNVFVPRNEKIVYTKGRSQESNSIYKTLAEPLDTDIPLVVLIDGNSASAAEIVSGALQDLDRAVVLGEQSFGKGLVQGTKALSFNTQMKITVSKYYLPSGRLIQKIDYKQKRKGDSSSVSNSSTYYTKNKRVVTEGNGIAPDLITNNGEKPIVLKQLESEHLFFHFADKFSSEQPNIPEPKKWNAEDELFNDFVKFIEKSGFSYKTKSDQLLENLQVKTKEEAYYDDLEQSIEMIKAALVQSKSKDLNRYKSEILEILETKIAERYYHERALIETQFDDNADIKKALEILTNQSQYKQILNP